MPFGPVSDRWIRLLRASALSTLLISAAHAQDDSAEHQHAPATAATTQWAREAALARGAGRVDLEKLELPPAPADVTDLSFREFFRSPIGPRGLEPTAKLTSLSGQRVRVAGYMVNQAKPLVGAFLFTPFPVQTDEHEYGFADDLPANTLRVFVADHAGEPVPLTPGIMLLTGTLEVGFQEEPDGRNSFVRLRLDPEADAPAPEPAEPTPAAN